MISVDLEAVRKVHMVGIAGIGMSAVARYFLSTGVHVSGYDRDRSDVAIALEEEGAKIHYQADNESIANDLDLAVFTPAVSEGHPEMVALRGLGVPLLKRSEVLGLISANSECIAVAGTHGKTTTSAIMTYLLRSGGLDCTAFLGGISVDLNGNFVFGMSDWMVLEADEYDRSFWHLEPRIAIVTSLDPDHLDVYGDYESMLHDYGEFLRKVKRGGTVILHESVQAKLGKILEQGLAYELMEKRIAILTYGEGDVFFKLLNNSRNQNGMLFDFHDSVRDATFRNIALSMVGRHNVENAGAAMSVALVLNRNYEVSDLDVNASFQALADFGGVKRRFELRYSSSDLVVIDDYAHHPEEVRAAVTAAREYYNSIPITGIFQPHLYSRTQDHYRDFAKALDTLDHVIITEIYPARELPIEGVSSALIANEMQNENVKVISSEDLEKELRDSVPGVLLFLGAGILDRRIDGIVKYLTS